MCIGLSGVSYVDFVYYTFNGLTIVRVKFDKEHFQKLIVKLNSFYRDYVVPQALTKKKREKIFFTKNFFMFLNKKQSSTLHVLIIMSFTLFTILKIIHFFNSENTHNFQAILKILVNQSPATDKVLNS